MGRDRSLDSNYVLRGEDANEQRRVIFYPSAMLGLQMLYHLVKASSLTRVNLTQRSLRSRLREGAAKKPCQSWLGSPSTGKLRPCWAACERIYDERDTSNHPRNIP